MQHWLSNRYYISICENISISRENTLFKREIIIQNNMKSLSHISILMKGSKMTQSHQEETK